MKKKIFIFVFALILFFCLLNITFAKSVSCTYGDTVSVIVGIDANSNLITSKNDKNPVTYKFDSISSGAFIQSNGDYYCPEKITYTLSYNSSSRMNDYVFSFISSDNYPNTLSLFASSIDNAKTNNEKVISKSCAYGSTGKYIINYYNDGTIGPGDNSYGIAADFPKSGDCLDAIYLCPGPVINKNNQTNCTKLSSFNESFVQTDPKPSTSGQAGGSTGQTSGAASDPTIQDCGSLLGSPDNPSAPAFYLNKAFSMMRYAAIIILIVFSIFDFVGALSSNDEAAIKKAVNKTIKRAIICVIIFLLPLLIKVILKYLDDRATDLCGIGE